jgi:integrase/recombinase XerD
VTALAPVLQGFFTERLAALRASEHTVAAYRDTYKLLLLFCQEQLKTPPSRLDLGQLDAPTITSFLRHLETERGNGVATRNLRLTTRCSATPRCAARSTPTPSPASWPSRTPARTGRS